MAHPRKRIREAFRARLAESVDGEYRTAAQSRVYASRMAPVNEEELKEDGPAILVYARMEKYNPEKDYGVEGDATYIERELTLVTEAMLLGGETVDDKLDDMAEQMEAAFEGFVIPGFESARMRLLESDIDVITEQVKRPIGAIGRVWQVIYRTAWRPRATADNIDADMADFLAGRQWSSFSAIPRAPAALPIRKRRTSTGARRMSSSSVRSRKWTTSASPRRIAS